MLTTKEKKTIRSHAAYHYNVAREGEANASIIKNKDETFAIDDWSCDSSGYGNCFKGTKLESLTLKEALDILAKVNKRAEKEDYYCVSWYVGGL